MQSAFVSTKKLAWVSRPGILNHCYIPHPSYATSTTDSYTNAIMTQQPENHAPNFLHEEDSSCRGMVASLALFHRDAIRRSDTYHRMIYTVLALGHVDVYVRKHLEHHSARVIWTLDPTFNTHRTTIEISRSAVEAEACMVFQSQRSKVIGMLAISYLIHCIRKALLLATQEKPFWALGQHEAEDERLWIERDEFMLQEERDGTTLSQPGGEDVLGSSSANTIGRICGEIREHRIFL